MKRNILKKGKKHIKNFLNIIKKFYRELNTDEYDYDNEIEEEEINQKKVIQKDKKKIKKENIRNKKVISESVEETNYVNNVIKETTESIKLDVEKIREGIELEKVTEDAKPILEVNVDGMYRLVRYQIIQDYVVSGTYSLNKNLIRQDNIKVMTRTR